MNNTDFFTDLLNDYMRNTKEKSDNLFVASEIGTKCILCDEEFVIRSNGDVVCPRCKRVWKRIISIFGHEGDSNE